FVITFREVLEAALVIVVVLAYLRTAGQTRYYKNVWAGLAAGIMLSIALALFFNMVYGGLTGKAEKIFEGSAMFLSVILLTWMIIWMASKSHIAELKEKVEREITERHAMGISALVAIAVLREGVEFVIFMHAASFAGSADLFGAVSGAAAALMLGYFLFAGIGWMSVRAFFKVTGIILVLFAAGLTSHGIHEFEEAGIISPVIRPLYDMTWLISKKDLTGSMLNSLFGYTGRPSLTEMAGYIGYLFLIFFLYRYAGSVGRAQGRSNQ
ncbi:MAG: FTR1 family protein, partial [Deltaproteobacteria bacterium]|nr:FTR1 family protein [Deltaproteobacteria bacterium]